MNMRNSRLLISCLIILFEVRITGSLVWERIPCSSDPDLLIPDGTSDLGRFPWLGIVQQDSFYIGGAARFIVTGGVLVHPKYAIAPAEDISRIIAEQHKTKPQLVLWHIDGTRYALDVIDYIFHPEYKEQRTLATLVLLELGLDGEVGGGETYFPGSVCVPLSSGAGSTFSDIYAVKMTDNNGELQKQVYKMKFVSARECNDFYYSNKLMYSMMTPLHPICARAERSMPPCVWDGGVALITRQSRLYWKLIGFSARGPGCGVPARFLVFNDYMSWINHVLSEAIGEETTDGQQMDFKQFASVETFDSKETLNIKPLSKDKEWSPDAPSGVGATGVAGSYGQGPAAWQPPSSSEERAIQRVMGRWGAEWLS